MNTTINEQAVRNDVLKKLGSRYSVWLADFRAELECKLSKEDLDKILEKMYMDGQIDLFPSDAPRADLSGAIWFGDSARPYIEAC